MKFIEISWQSDRYEQEISLRDEMLRAPLGLTFTPDDLIAEQGQFHFGIISQQQLIACLVVVPLTSTLAKIRQMCVADSHQRKGIGSRLIKHTEATLVDRGFHDVELHARDLVTRFYEQLGYQTIGDAFTEVTIRHFKMVKQIYPPR